MPSWSHGEGPVCPRGAMGRGLCALVDPWGGACVPLCALVWWTGVVVWTEAMGRGPCGAMGRGPCGAMGRGLCAFVGP